MTEGVKVQVKLFGGLRALAATYPLLVNLPQGGTVEGLLLRLEKDQPQLGTKLRVAVAEGFVNVLVDGKNAALLEGIETALSDGASVAFVPPVGGG